MNKIAGFVLAGLLAGCAATLNQQLVYIRIDGKTIPDNPQLSQQFDTDKTICVGEMQKANLSGAVISTGNVFMDVSNDLDRSRSENAVMLGCMASRGYKLVTVPIS